MFSALKAEFSVEKTNTFGRFLLKLLDSFKRQISSHVKRLAEFNLYLTKLKVYAPNAMAQEYKSPAASHMLWFFILPAFAFLGWATYKLLTEFQNTKVESSLLQKARQIEKGRSDGDRWKAAYALAEELLKKSQSGDYAKLPDAEKKEIVGALKSLTLQFKDDLRLKKYLILTAGRLGDVEALPLIKSGLKDEDEDLRFYSAWGYPETLVANPGAIQADDLALFREWLRGPDMALKKIATSFLVQYDPSAISEVVLFLKDPDKELRWNAAVALASTGRSEGRETLEEIFNLQNLRDFGFRSAKDMEQLLRAAKVASLKLNNPEVLQKMESLKKQANKDNPEDRAIRNAL